MDINNNTQQINTFVGGMNTDISESNIPKNQYRFAKNVRVVSRTLAKDGELHAIEGVSDLNIAGLPESYEILKLDSIRKYLIIILRVDNTWKIFRYNWEDSGSNAQCIYTSTTPIWDDESKCQLSTVLRWEDDNNIKLYIADGIHEIFSCNIMEQQSQNSTNYKLLPFTYNRMISGTLKPAIVLYSYRLYKMHGVSTEMSPISKAIVINNYSSLSDNVIKTSEVRGYKQGTNTGYGVECTVQINDYTNYDRIVVYRITYELIDQSPTVDIIRDEKLYSGSYTLKDDGSTVATLSYDEYSSIYTNLKFCPNVIESKDDYLFAAGINYKYSKTDDLFKDWDARSYSFGDYINGTQISLSDYKDDLNVPQDANVINANLLLQNNYVALDWFAYDTGNTVPVDNQTDIFYSENSENRIGGAGLNVSWHFIEKDYIIDNNIGNRGILIYKSESYSEPDSIKSLRRDEVYRYGIVLYSDSGKRSSVKWIADIRIPDVRTCPTINIQGIVGEQKMYSRNIGIKFYVNPPENCSGFEIVRCIKTINDSSIIAQGLLEGCVKSDVDEYDQGYVCSPGVVTASQLKFRTMHPDEYFFGSDDAHPYLNNYTTSVTTDVVKFISPEISYLPDDYKDAISAEESLQFKILGTLKPALAGSNGKVTYTNGTNDGEVSIDFISPFISSGDSSSHMYYVESPNYKDFEDDTTAYITALDSWELRGTTSENTRNDIDFRKSCYLKLYNYSSYNAGRFYLITNKEITDTPEYDQFVNAESTSSELLIEDHVTPIGNYTYLLYSVPTLLSLISNSSFLSRDVNNDLTPLAYCPFGASGKGMIATTQNKINLTSDPFGAYLVNITKQVTPYGGYYYNNKINSIYTSHGYYCSVEDDNIAELDVFDGDCYIQQFEYASMHTWRHSLNANENGIPALFVCTFPVETNVNIINDYGTSFTSVQDVPYSVNMLAVAGDFGGFIQDTPMYQNNTAYSSELNACKFTGEDYTLSELDKHYDYRIHVSNIKTNNENIDSWTTFQSANYIDVDTRYGAINDIGAYKDRLFFWQDNAFGFVYTNEQLVLQDTDSTQLLLGTASLLQNYNYISETYGAQRYNVARANSDHHIYWWDSNQKEVLQYIPPTRSSAAIAQPLVKSKSIKSYINTNENVSIPNIMWDLKYSELVCNVVSGGPVVYNEDLLVFTAVYDVDVKRSCDVQGNTVVSSGDNLYVYGKSEQGGPYDLNKSIIQPYIKYIVNESPQTVKVYDSAQIGCCDSDSVLKLNFVFKTSLNQTGKINTYKNINLYEHDYRFSIPRAGKMVNDLWKSSNYGDRLRGKTLSCEITAYDNIFDFSLLYVITKYRISWN